MAHPQHLSRRATYTLPALQKYLTHISLPAAHQRIILQNLPSLGRSTASAWGTSSEALGVLGTLQKYQQVKMPFANLYLHYSPFHVGVLDAEGLFRYLVCSEAMVSSSARGGVVATGGEGGKTERESLWDAREPSGGRGGSCTLNNGFFGTVMRTLGMQVKTTGARVALSYSGGPEGVYGGWNHLVNLVRCEGRTFLVDVGFSGNAPTAPLELQDGVEIPWGATSDLVRLIHASIPEFTDPTSKVWILQHKRAATDAWNPIYVFTTTEFLPQDIHVMNYSTTRNIRSSFFNHKLICSARLMEDGEIVGTLSLVDAKVKKRVRGTTEMLSWCASEVERWEALETWFGIVLGPEERAGIRGLVTELKGAEELGGE